MFEAVDALAEPVVPLSALEHWSYCARQAGLILLEDGYAENADTVRGSLAHAQVDAGVPRYDAGGHQLRALPVFSDRLGLAGIADVVELRGDTVVPIEFKVGRYRPGGPADVQVGGQALCLEEMFRCTVPMGAVFSVRERRRHPVAITDALRETVVAATAAVRSMLRDHALAAAVDDGRCPGCSMIEVCVPMLTSGSSRAQRAEVALFDVRDVEWSC